MNVLLIYFALPIAVIIFSIVLQKVFKCPLIVASIIFAIFLVVAFLVDVANFLVATIAYTILSFITAYITMLICKLINVLENNNSCTRNNGNTFLSNDSNTQLINGTLQIGTNGTSCSCSQSNNNAISVVANVTPNFSNNGRTGRFAGCYRR